MRLVYVVVEVPGETFKVTDVPPAAVIVHATTKMWQNKEETGYGRVKIGHSLPDLNRRSRGTVIGVFDTENIEHVHSMLYMSERIRESNKYYHMLSRDT